MVADGPPGLAFGRGSKGMSFRQLGRQVDVAFRRLRAPSLAWRRERRVRKPNPRLKPALPAETARHNLWALF